MRECILFLFIPFFCITTKLDENHIIIYGGNPEEENLEKNLR